jgi:IPT/TIG domain-containing protein
LRVYLERPWYSSGEGELLGIVLASTASSERDPFVTHWGRDPLWQSPALPNPERPTPDAFRNPVQVVTNVSLHQEDFSHPAGDPAALVTVVAYDVTIADGRCFCDIEIDPGRSYYPFTRLALARFQPNSLKDSELSRVAVADFMQIAPTRSVAVVRQAANRFDVTVSGPTHQTSTDPINPGAQTGTQIRVSAQKRMEFATDDAGWLPAGDGVVVSPVVAAPSGDILWQGTVTVPSGPGRGQLRLLMEELELHKGTGPVPVSRVVFAETFFVDLPGPLFATFDPGTGGQETIVTLRGGNFNFAPVSVQFGDRTAEIEGTPNAVLIKAKVPAGFTTQSRVKIKITTAGGSVVSTSDFIVIPPPVFRAFDPGTGAQGTVVNLRGDNFNFTPIAVQFGEATAVLDGAPTATLIKAKVPTGFTAQSPVKIKITTAGGSVVSTSDFVVTLPPPVFRAVDPCTGRPGTVVNLRGDNFNFEPVSVRFGDRTADIEGTPTATLIKAKVPTGFTAQSRVKIRIATAGGSVSAPAISS